MMGGPPGGRVVAHDVAASPPRGALHRSFTWPRTKHFFLLNMIMIIVMIRVMITIMVMIIRYKIDNDSDN